MDFITLLSREIGQLNKMVLDKDQVVKGCQDQLNTLLQKDYGSLKVIMKGFSIRVSYVKRAL